MIPIRLDDEEELFEDVDEKENEQLTDEITDDDVKLEEDEETTEDDETDDELEDDDEIEEV